VKVLHPCREGKKLLVLDIDYTLFDHKERGASHLG
jgi:ubiquitin-like domain-containing CTD phosphatase 1